MIQAKKEGCGEDVQAFSAKLEKLGDLPFWHSKKSSELSQNNLESGQNKQTRVKTELDQIQITWHYLQPLPRGFYVHHAANDSYPDAIWSLW